MVLEVLETFTSSGIKESTTLTIYQNCSFVGRHPLCVCNLEGNVFCFGRSVSLGHSFQRIFVCSQCSYRHQAVAPWCDGTNLVLHGDCPGSVRVSSFQFVTHWHREQACVGTTRATDSCLYRSIDRSIDRRRFGGSVLKPMRVGFHECSTCPPIFGFSWPNQIPRSSHRRSTHPVAGIESVRDVQNVVHRSHRSSWIWHGPLRHTPPRSFGSFLHPQPTGLVQWVHLIRSAVRRWVARFPSIVLTILPLGSVGSDRIPYPIRSTSPSTSHRSLLPAWTRVSIS